jgi:plastocyanin
VGEGRERGRYHGRLKICPSAAQRTNFAWAIALQNWYSCLWGRPLEGARLQFHIEKIPVMRSLPIVVILGVAAGAAVGAEFEVRQAGRLFAPARLIVGKGSTVHFANDEKFVHHAFTDSAVFSADTGDIPPGESRDIVFTRPGVFTIRCAIHPQMRMTVEVSEQE